MEINLNFKEYGQGNPLLILHGLFGSLDNWHSLSTRFGEHFKVFNIDQRNHGKSPHTDHHSISLMASDLKQFILFHGLNKVSVIGHSMGGKVAMQAALSHPELFNKIVIADIAPRKYPHGHDDIFKALNAVDLTAITSRKDAEEQITPLVYDAGVRLFLLKNLERNNDGSFSWKMNLPVLFKDYEKIIDKVNGNSFLGKTLFLKGENSKYIQDKDLPDIEFHFPNHTLITLPNAGHWLHAEQPELFYKSVLDFLVQP